MSNGMPYAKWYPRDWLGDPQLRMVDLADRGLWIDLLNHMMLGEPYGHLTINGRAMTDDEAARAVGVDKATLMGGLQRLEAVGIPSRTPDGILYSRRLVRDYEQFTFSRETGKRGGNPALRVPPLDPSSENPESRIQNPESRSQKPYARRPTPRLTPPITHPIRGGEWVDFDDFWNVYPKKVGKKAAQKAWKAAKDRPAIAEILASVERSKSSDQWQRECGQYIPNPATWINQGRWSDVIPEKPRELTFDERVALDDEKMLAERKAKRERGEL